MNHTEVLIIGQGLAGTLLGRALARRGVAFTVLDKAPADEPGASRIAGAIINPLPGRRLTLPPGFEAAMSALAAAYPQGPGGFRQLPILRIFRDATERQAAERRRSQEDYQRWLGDRHQRGGSEQRTAKGLQRWLDDRHGGCWVEGGGVLDTAAFLDGQRQQWVDSGCLQELTVDPAHVTVQSDGVEVGDWHGQRLVFCDGWRVRQNPWFNWLFITPLKGEILSFRSDQPLGDVPLIRGHWLLPIFEQAGCYRIGATYERQFSEAGPTRAGRETLLAGLAGMLPGLPPVEILDHQAGVRPGNSSNIPFIGWHPEQPRLGAFNGLGSRGALLAPVYAEALADNIALGTELPATANLALRGRKP